MNLSDYLEPLPLVAVLRGITPEETPAIAEALCAEGFRILEVPLNSPRPFESIRLLAEHCGDRCLVGDPCCRSRPDPRAVWFGRPACRSSGAVFRCRF